MIDRRQFLKATIAAAVAPQIPVKTWVPTPVALDWDVQRVNGRWTIGTIFSDGTFRGTAILK